MSNFLAQYQSPRTCLWRPTARIGWIYPKGAEYVSLEGRSRTFKLSDYLFERTRIARVSVFTCVCSKVDKVFIAFSIMRREIRCLCVYDDILRFVLTSFRLCKYSILGMGDNAHNKLESFFELIFI